MQVSVFQAPLLRPTAEPRRQSSMHLQPAGLGQHALAHGHCGALLTRSQFLHCKPGSAGHQTSRARLTPAALAIEALATTSSSAPLLMGALSLVGALIFLLNGGNKKQNHPPGPPALVFLAKFLTLRRSVFYVRPILRELHARYGGIISIRLFKTTLVFVQDRALAHRMLVQGGATFADRPASLYEPWPTFFQGSIITAPYDTHWRRVRRNLVETLHPACIAGFAQARNRTRNVLLARLLAAGAGTGELVTVRMIFRRTMFDLMAFMCLGSGLSTETLDDIFNLQNQAFAAVTGFPYFAAFLPLTKRIFWKRWAVIQGLSTRREAILSPLLQARRQASSSDPKSYTDDDPRCYADTLLAVRLPDEGDHALTDAEIRTLCSEFMVAGTDTTTSLLEWIMAELVSHPDAQSKVYHEVSGEDEVREGNLRKMSYLKAVVLEGFRMHPGAHLVFPHRTMKDTEVGGYTVPKDAEVNFLVADYGLDGTAWTNPGEFRPERFLDGGEGQGLDVTGSREVKMMTFGAGRRMCPGYSLATMHLEYLVGSLVREFEWLPAVQGEQIDMTEDLDGVIVLKEPLRVRLIPRKFLS